GSFGCECRRGYRGGRCANTDGSFDCYCPAGFRTDADKALCQGEGLGLPCPAVGLGRGGCPTAGAARGSAGLPARVLCPADVDECQEYGTVLCGAQRCENIPGSYRCVADCQPGYQAGAGGDCVGECERAVCWQEVGPDLVCGRPRLDRQVTYTECCCLYGEAWGMDCALCPARDSGAAPRAARGPPHPLGKGDALHPHGPRALQGPPASPWTLGNGGPFAFPQPLGSGNPASLQPPA
uniref:LTBP4 protein n=1 Tax=Dromaius novaehollandiae TaxID=8790 RepID=A0A8C4JUX0_DRONO